MDIEEFYSADERRRSSEEIELGTEWHDPNGARCELSWIVDTGELYVMLEPPVGGLIEDPFGDVYEVGKASVDQLTVAVVGWIPDRDKLDQVLTGWQDHMGEPNSVTWLAERLKQEGIPRSAPVA